MSEISYLQVCNGGADGTRTRNFTNLGLANTRLCVRSCVLKAAPRLLHALLASILLSACAPTDPSLCLAEVMDRGSDDPVEIERQVKACESEAR